MHRTLRVNTSKIFQEPLEVFTEAYLEPCQTLRYFCENAPSYVFDRVLNTSTLHSSFWGIAEWFGQILAEFLFAKLGLVTKVLN